MTINYWHMSKAMTEKQKTRFQIKKTATGLGLFAKKVLKKGDFIVEYTGKKITQEEGYKMKNGRYLMHYDDNFIIDGKGYENIGRYINHSCKANSTTYMVNKKIKFYAKRSIQVGEEITFDYGKEYFDEYIKPLGCKCNSCLQK